MLHIIVVVVKTSYSYLSQTSDLGDTCITLLSPCIVLSSPCRFIITLQYFYNPYLVFLSPSSISLPSVVINLYYCYHTLVSLLNNALKFMFHVMHCVSCYVSSIMHQTPCITYHVSQNMLFPKKVIILFHAPKTSNCLPVIYVKDVQLRRMCI